MKLRAQKIRDRIWVQWKGRIYSLAAASPSRRRGGASEGPLELSAPFACKVLRLHVSEGQSLKKGDPLVVVEAMKMEYAYASPRDGVVERVLVKEGEIIQGGSRFVQWKNG